MDYFSGERFEFPVRSDLQMRPGEFRFWRWRNNWCNFWDSAKVFLETFKIFRIIEIFSEFFEIYLKFLRQCKGVVEFFFYFCNFLESL